MKKIYFILFLALAFSFRAQSQACSISYFEIFTKQAYPTPHSGMSLNKDSLMARINNVPDSAMMHATFVAAVNDPTKVDSVFYTLTNSQGHVVYTGSIKATAMQGNTAYGVKGKTLYFKVGPYSYLKKFTASLKIKGTDGQFTPVKTFAKN